MLAISPWTCERRPSSAKSQTANSPVLLAGQSWKDPIIMTYPAFSATLSPDMAARTAQAWYQEAASLATTAIAVSDMAASLAEAADKLLNATVGAPLTAPAPSPLPSGVYDLSAFRARRQAVSR